MIIKGLRGMCLFFRFTALKGLFQSPSKLTIVVHYTEFRIYTCTSKAYLTQAYVCVYVYHRIQRYIDAQTCIQTANARACSGSSLCRCVYPRVCAAQAISRLQPPRQSFKA